MNTLSENAKLRFDLPPRRAADARSDTAPPSETQLDDAEAQMRRALGLKGESPRPRVEAERTDPSPRPVERVTPMHRRRFVQDGDVPVTVVRRDLGGDAVSRPASGPSSNWLQRTEAALSAETISRERTERLLAEALAQVRELRTKLGHAELARAEVMNFVRREKEASAGLRQRVEELERQRRSAEANAASMESEFDCWRFLSRKRGTQGWQLKGRCSPLKKRENVINNCSENCRSERRRR